MKVIAVLNQKGGAGKTTIATHLATELRLQGYTVTLIDSDPQGSARDWAAAREDHPLPVIGMDRPTIEKDIKALAKADFYVIDGAPQAAELAVSAIKAADLILIPVQPSPYDVWATADLVDLVKARIEITDGKLEAYFVVSRVITGTNVGKEIDDILRGYDLPILDTKIYQRVGYSNYAGSGSTVMEAEPRSEGTLEMRRLADEVIRVVHGAKE